MKILQNSFCVSTWKITYVCKFWMTYCWVNNDRRAIPFTADLWTAAMSRTLEWRSVFIQLNTDAASVLKATHWYLRAELSYVGHERVCFSLLPLPPTSLFLFHDLFCWKGHHNCTGPAFICLTHNPIYLHHTWSLPSVWRQRDHLCVSIPKYLFYGFLHEYVCMYWLLIYLLFNLNPCKVSWWRVLMYLHLLTASVSMCYVCSLRAEGGWNNQFPFPH